MNGDHDTHDASYCSDRLPRVKTRFFASELTDTDSIHENEEPMQGSERDDDNQDDSELFLADDDDGDFNELAAETSSLASSDSSGFVCNDQGTITAVRLRPMLPSEKKSGYRAIVDMSVNNDYSVTTIVNPAALPPPSQSHTSSKYTSSKLPLMELTQAPNETDFPPQFTQEFKFDYSYWSFDRSPERQVATQSTVYDSVGVFVLDTVLQGQNCSVFAYGQPGAGKTYTMMGSSKAFPAYVRANSRANGVKVPSTLLTSERRGLIPRICQGLLAEIDEGKTSGRSSTLIISYVEIYDERVYDLLSNASIKKSLKVREHPEEGAFVERAKRVRATSYAQVLELIEEGNRTRSQSSCRPARSHTVLTLSLTQNTLASEVGSLEKSLKSRLCLVDLASAERMDHSATNGLGLREAASINRSLGTLADVVSALAKRIRNRAVDESQRHVPYRNSVLTRLLKESLGGRSKTIMLGAISPCCAHYEESIATLRYIGRAKSVYGTTRAHVDTNGDTTQRFLNEASELKTNLCDFNLSEVPLAMANVCCGIPEHHEGCVDCEACDHRSSKDNTADLKSLAACEQDRTKDDETKKGSSICGNELRVETRADCAKNVEMGDQVLRRSVVLLKLVAIRRRCQLLSKYRALDRWRKLVVWHAKTIVEVRSHQDKMERESLERGGSATLSPLSGRKTGYPPLHTRSPTAETQIGGRVQDVVAAVVATDAICCSVVQEFIFPHCEDSSKQAIQRANTTTSSSLLELLASSSEFDRSDCRLTCRLDELAETWCNLEDDQFGLPTQFDSLDFKEELTTAKNWGSNSRLLSPGTQCEENTTFSSLSLCVDSIDMARRALGPGERNLRRRTKDDTRAPSGVECELLRYLDKRCVVMTRRLEELMDALQSHPETRAPSQSCCDALETMVGEFCLQIVARLCDRLPSASSACVAGRLQLETQLEDYGERLKQLLPDLARESGDIETNPDENAANAVFSVATDLLVMTERIKLIWSFAEHKKRERLLQVQVLKAATIKDRKIAAKIAALEEQNAELSARCDAFVATNGELTANGSEINDHTDTNLRARHANEKLDHLEVGYDTIAASKSADNLGPKLAVEVARTWDVQIRNDELLCSFATLNSALAAASARVRALEAENSRLSFEVQDSACKDGKNDSAKSQMALATRGALQDHVFSLQKELENANSHSNVLEGQLKGLKSTGLKLCPELKSVEALLNCEKEARKSVEADLILLEMQANAKMEGIRQQRDDAEARARELEEAEARRQEINEAFMVSKAVNAELSASLAQAKAELLIALEKNCQAESQSVHHIAAIEGLKMSLYQAQAQRESAEMAAEELKLKNVRNQVSGQANQICVLETRIRHEEQNMQELQSKVTVHDRDEHALLLSETPCEREKVLQLDTFSAWELDETNRVRGELHEATLEIGSLREELTELLDYSTLQSATIDTLKLEQTETRKTVDELELERDELVLRCEREQHISEQKERARHMAQLHAQQSAESLSRLERQLETERQGSMAMHETLQQQMSAILGPQTQQHSLEVSRINIVRGLETRVETVSTEVQIVKAKELESTHGAAKAQMPKFVKQTQSSEALVLQQHLESRRLTQQLDECQMDLHASTQRWVRAETQSGLLRICITHLHIHIAQLKEAYLMQVADIESARLRDDSCPMFTEATYETAQTVNDHLSSVDAWFEEVISGNQASATGPGSVTEIVGKRSKSIGEDYVARSSLLKTLPDLSALTNELQTVCEASPQANDQPNCRTDEHLAKGTDHHDANVNTNSVMEDQQESTFEGKEAVTIQNTKASSEVVQLRKIVVKLKEALDSKDDMLLILDGKVKSLELLASK